ncbi:hypothetical protein TWF694_003506 [Orbilia ellipsospora]|uniref:Uncharacterized protein n=1 Tax=Orbilia ellipsospora TaxID=2528407 RepID=A0AAV9WZR0_9PEZI
MLSSTIFSVALSYGLLGLRALAGPVTTDQLAVLQPIREDDLTAGNLKLQELRSRSIADSMANAVELLPLHEDEFTPSHLRKRGDDLSRLDLKDEVRMIYGGVTAKSQIYMANMTLYQPSKDHPLIMMESFDSLLKSVSCSTGSTKLSFNTKEAMDYAIKAWDWVNEREADHFFLIANHKSCGDDTQRTPYKVVGVKYDDKAFTSVLTTEPIAWDSLAGDFELNLGSAVLPSRLRRRGVQVSSVDITKRGFWDIFTTFDFGKSVYWDLSVGDHSRRSIFQEPFHEIKRLEVTCVGCYITGGIQISGYVKVENFAVKVLQFGAKPKNFNAKVEIETVLRAAIPKGAFNLDQTLFEMGIPGLSIPGIFTLGPSLQYHVGFGLSTSGVANFSVGVTASLPNTAALINDVTDGSNSGATGFEGSTIKPILKMNELSVSAFASVYSQPNVAFGVKVLTKYGAECTLELKLPVVNVGVTGGFNERGFCPEKDRSITNGMKVTAGANIELWFKAVKFTGLSKWFPDFDRKLWGVRWPFLDSCFPWGPANSGQILPEKPTEMLSDLGLPTTGPVTLDEAETLAPIPGF